MRHRLPHPLILAAWAACAALHLGFLWSQGGAFALSSDDFSRALIAARMARGDWSLDQLWPPLPFWIEALALRLSYAPDRLPSLINAGWSLIGLAAVPGLARASGAREPAAAAALLLAGTLHWQVWTGCSGLAEAPGVALALWSLRASAAGLAGLPAAPAAALLACLAGMCRYELWGLALPGTYWLLRDRPARWRTALALLWVFPAAWMIANYRWEQAPLAFASAARDAIQSQEQRPPLLQPLLDLADASHLLPGLGAIGLSGALALAAREGAPRIARAAEAAVALAALMAAAQILGFAGLHNTPRHWLLPAALLAVGAALQLQHLHDLGRTRLTALLLAMQIGLEISALPSPPASHDPDTAALALRLRAMQGGQIPEDGTILLEVCLYEYAALPVLVGRPERIAWDRNPWIIQDPASLDAPQTGNLPLLNLSPLALRDELRHRRYAAAVTARPHTAEKVRAAGWREIGAEGRYTIFLRP